jgi:hypothetical protein
LAFNSSYTKRLFTLLLIAIGLTLFSNLHAEDGYETWLRYDKVESAELLKEYNLLTKRGNLGFYKRAEITTIFAINKYNTPRNLYTIIVFEEASPNLNQN